MTTPHLPGALRTTPPDELPTMKIDRTTRLLACAAADELRKQAKKKPPPLPRIRLSSRTADALRAVERSKVPTTPAPPMSATPATPKPPTPATPKPPRPKTLPVVHAEDPVELLPVEVDDADLLESIDAPRRRWLPTVAAAAVAAVSLVLLMIAVNGLPFPLLYRSPAATPLADRVGPATNELLPSPKSVDVASAPLPEPPVAEALEKRE